MSEPKGVRLKFKPPVNTPKPGDAVAKYRYSVSVGGTVLESGEKAVADETFVPVDPGDEGVDAIVTYSLADAKGNWQPDRTKVQRINPDPDTTAPPEDAGDLDVTDGTEVVPVAEVPAEEVEAPTEAPAETAPEATEAASDAPTE